MLNLLLLLAACTPTAESNVLGYYLARRLGTLTMQPETATGTLTGIVTNTTGEAIEGATVVVATRTGTRELYDSRCPPWSVCPSGSRTRL